MNSFLIKQLSICDWKRNEKGMAWKEGSGDCEQWIRLEEREYRNKRGGFCFKYVYFIRNCHRNGRYPLMVLIAKPNLSYCAYLLLQFWFQICNYGPNFPPMQRQWTNSYFKRTYPYMKLFGFLFGQIWLMFFSNCSSDFSLRQVLTDSRGKTTQIKLWTNMWFDVKFAIWTAPTNQVDRRIG